MEVQRPKEGAIIQIVHEGYSRNMPATLYGDNQLNWDIISNIFQYLPFESLMSCRRISRIWNVAFSFPENRGRVKFIIEGETVEKYAKSRATLQASTIKWRHFEFLNLDMEKQALGDRTFFEFFVKHFRFSILTISFGVCRLSLGRFIETIAYCRNIKGISVTNTPHLYMSTFYVLNWKDYLPYFFENIANVTSLQIIEDFLDIRSTICTWVGHMQKLSSLAISSTSSRLQGPDIVRVIYKNWLSLTELHLSGKYDNIILTPEDWKNIANMNLKLKKLSLENLSLTLPLKVPHSSPAFKNLETLIITDCKDENSTYNIFNDSAKISVIQLRNVNASMNYKASVSLFKQSRFNLEVLALNIKNAKEAYYQFVLKRCINLKVLDLSDSNSDDKVLAFIVTRLEKLVSCNLRNTLTTMVGLDCLLKGLGHQLQFLDVSQCRLLDLSFEEYNITCNSKLQIVWGNPESETLNHENEKSGPEEIKNEEEKPDLEFYQ